AKRAFEAFAMIVEIADVRQEHLARPIQLDEPLHAGVAEARLLFHEARDMDEARAERRDQVGSVFEAVSVAEDPEPPRSLADFGNSARPGDERNPAERRVRDVPDARSRPPRDPSPASARTARSGRARSTATSRCGR